MKKKTHTLGSVEWYTEKPRELSKDKPNLKNGDLIRFSRKLRVWYDMTRKPDGRQHGTRTTFPKGTVGIYLGELSHLPWSLIPDLRLFIDGKNYQLEHKSIASIKIVND